jgi:hypothetical protein
MTCKSGTSTSEKWMLRSGTVRWIKGEHKI